MEINDRDLLHIENILEFCNDIFSTIDEFSIDYDSFNASTARKGVLAFFVEQIGEEANKLSPNFRQSHSEIDWKAIINFRHHIVHAYIGVIPDVLWDTVQNDIPELKNFCELILNKRNYLAGI